MRSRLLLLAAEVVLCCSILTTEACGPGRGGGRRLRHRRYPPLVQRQYIPNVSENTVGASGLPEGPIKRKDKRFKEFVQNWNPDIVFRDDERTGADRMMTQRLKEKLSVLAISVLNQWPNVKLRVIEGWDEDMRHSINSLHYEGRAVDITTSDKDRSKYGMLARLAVEAGFDWVHYESRSHVHCSVKSEKADTIRNNGCFDSNSLVRTPAGEMEMSQLQTNDPVLTMNPRTGQLQFSPIIMWLDRDEQREDLFVELKTKSDKLIRLTSSHLIFVADEPPSDLIQFNEQKPFTYTPQSGNVDNKHENFYFYETQSSTATSKDGSESGPASIDVPSMVDQFTYNPEYSLKTPPTTTTNLNVDEIAYTTYARNLIVGQYLLINQAENSNEQSKPELIVRGNDINGREYQLPYLLEAFDSPSRLVFANDRLQDDVQNASSTRDGSKIKFDQIVSVNYVTKRGIYAPLTREGNIVVNSIVASCYAVISENDLAHMSFAPVRWFSYLNEWLFGLEPQTPLSERTVEAGRRQSLDQELDTQTYYHESIAPTRPIQISPAQKEMHWYPSLLYRIAKFILPSRYLF